MQWATPVFFAERFAQLLKMDSESLFSHLVWLILKFMSANGKLWLDHHPGLQAAVATNVAMDIVSDPRTRHHINVKLGTNLKDDKELDIWTNVIQKLTLIDRSDLQELYLLTKKEILA